MCPACRYDLLYNPRRFLGWDQLAKTYHEAADWVLVGAFVCAETGWHNECRTFF